MGRRRRQEEYQLDDRSDFESLELVHEIDGSKRHQGDKGNTDQDQSRQHARTHKYSTTHGPLPSIFHPPPNGTREDDGKAQAKA